MQHLLLVDGHHMMYRAFYAVPRTLQTKSGELTNAVYGMASMMLSMLKAESPDYLLVCFDAGEETFRHKEHAAYKEGRAETPDEFYAQIPRIHELLQAFAIPSAMESGVEADDLLCTYARHAERDGFRATIVTGDRDAFQVASDRIRVAIPHKGYLAPEYLGPSEILQKYGITPAQVPAYKGLSGDSSDNLPGVQGIGPKTASQLLQQFGSLEAIYEHLDDIRPTVRAKLEKDREQAFFCQRMALLLETAPERLTWDDLAVGKIDAAQAQAFLRQMEFHSLVSRLNSLVTSPYGQRFCPSGSTNQEPTASSQFPGETQEQSPQLSLF